MSAELKGCVIWFMYCLDFLQVRYNFAKFHQRRICVTDFREWGGLFASPLFPSPICEQPRKGSSWIGLKINICIEKIFLKEIRIIKSYSLQKGTWVKCVFQKKELVFRSWKCKETHKISVSFENMKFLWMQLKPRKFCAAFR